MSRLGRVVLTGLAILLPAALAGASVNAPGDLDTSFGDGGHALVLVGTFGAEATAVAVQPDGKILVGGWTVGGPPPPRRAQDPEGDDHVDFAVVRLDPNGALDPTFGTGGMVSTPIDLVPGGYDRAWAIALGPDGSIVLAGGAEAGGATNDFAVVRYTPAGALDPTFSEDGIQTVDLGGDNVLTGVAVQPGDGNIVAAGRSGNDGGFTTIRLRADGDLDGSFGSGGIVQTPVGDSGAQDITGAVGLVPGGKIVVAGTADITAQAAYAVARYLSDGQLDPGFGDNGVTVTDRPGDEEVSSLAIAPDGKIALGGILGVTPIAFRVERYLEDGELDASFGQGGIATTHFGSNDAFLTGLVAQSDGKLVAAGRVLASRYLYGLARYLDDGTLDSSFGDAGTRTYQYAQR